MTYTHGACAVGPGSGQNAKSNEGRECRNNNLAPVPICTADQVATRWSLVSVLRKVLMTTFTAVLKWWPTRLCHVGGASADVLVRKSSTGMPTMEIRVAVIGNVDSGKSTLVGVLTRGMLDDGRGLARSKVVLSFKRTIVPGRNLAHLQCC